MIYAYFAGAIATVLVAERSPRKLRQALYAALALALLAAPAFDRNDATYNVLADAGIFVLLALGLNIVVGFAGLLDLGYAAFFAIGAYTYGMLASPQFGLHIPLWALLFLAGALAALFGAHVATLSRNTHHLP